MPVNDLERAVATLTLSHQLLTPAEAIRLISAARVPDADMVSLLLEHLDADLVLAAIAAELNLAWVDLHSSSSAYRVDDELVRRCDLDLLKENNALPLLGPNGVVAAMANPRSNHDMVEYLKSHLGDDVQLVMASKTQIQARLVHFTRGSYDELGPDTAGASSSSATKAGALPSSVADNPVVDWVDNLLARAAAEGASDVHFKFEADGTLLVRFRVDGMLVRQNVPLRKREREIVGTLLSKCSTIDPLDRTRPQDGTFSFAAVGGRKIDARLGMLPQAYGPTVVCRLLDPENINRKLEDMGFAADTLTQMRRIVASPQGAVFVIGPTGHGKTTTLYSLLKELPALELNILTAEDPIEYRLPYVGQTQIRSDLGDKSLTFAKTLRSMLRLDPDVVLVGEVRDTETAETAMHAALTGHLVLSTLHAKSALGAYSRLEELGVEPFLTSESLSLAINQRLIRTVHSCAVVEAPNAAEVAFLRRHGFPMPDVVTHPSAKGCSGCNGTGYRGRVAVVEVLEPNDEVRTMVAERRSLRDIATAAQREGYTSILDDAYRHVREGRSTVRELLRVIDTGGN